MGKSMMIYTAGKMNGLSMEQQMGWRKAIEDGIKARTDESIRFIHPPLYFNYEFQNHKTQAEIKEWELNHVRNCDVVVVNMNGINGSVGTHFELAFIDACNQFGDKHIYVVGIGDTTGVHPWILDTIYRHEDTIEDACDYITNYLLF